MSEHTGGEYAPLVLATVVGSGQFLRRHTGNVVTTVAVVSALLFGAPTPV